MKTKYKPLDMFAEQTDELKRLIAEHPDYPITVCCNYDVIGDDHGSWYAPKLSFFIGEILDCEQDIDDEKVYMDRDEFREDVEYKIGDLPDEYFNREVVKILKQYEPYWKKVIVIRGSM